MHVTLCRFPYLNLSLLMYSFLPTVVFCTSIHSLVVAVTSIFSVPYAHICLLWYCSHYFLSCVNHLSILYIKHTLVCMRCFVFVLLIIFSPFAICEFDLGATHYTCINVMFQDPSTFCQPIITTTAALNY